MYKGCQICRGGSLKLHLIIADATFFSYITKHLSQKTPFGQKYLSQKNGCRMLFMVVEQFKNDSAGRVYRRAQQKGRMLPDGLHYVDSWVATDFDCCFQLMETEDPTLFHKWTKHWQDLVEFKIIAVVSSEEARKAVLHPG
jgi:Domain of unknown function (DUF3303)